jgi:hypothetical protein
VKNQYFGDVNDLVKYGLLRSLVDGNRIRGVVCWMLTLDDERTDGQDVAYLQQPKRYRALDPVLFDALQRAVLAGQRDVAVAHESELVPGAVYFDEILYDSNGERTAYFDRLWRVAAQRELVFFDPDNGFEVASVGRGSRGSSRYVFLDEIADAYSYGHSVLVYQHFPRVRRSEFIEIVRARVLDRLGVAPLMLRTPRVLFVLIPQDRDREILAERVEGAAARWTPHILAQS